MIDIFPFVLSIYQEIRKERIPTIIDSIISLVLYLKEMKRIGKMKVEMDGIVAVNTEVLQREIEKYRGGTKEDILKVVKELNLSSKSKKKICKYFV